LGQSENRFSQPRKIAILARIFWWKFLLHFWASLKIDFPSLEKSRFSKEIFGGNF